MSNNPPHIPGYVTWYDESSGADSSARKGPGHLKPKHWEKNIETWQPDFLYEKLIARTHKWAFNNPGLAEIYSEITDIYDLPVYLAHNPHDFYFLYKPCSAMLRFVSDKGFKGEIARYRLEAGK